MPKGPPTRGEGAGKRLHGRDWVEPLEFLCGCRLARETAVVGLRWELGVGNHPNPILRVVARLVRQIGITDERAVLTNLR
jgi:hypothetical protein